jgi:hypothetical protein
MYKNLSTKNGKKHFLRSSKLLHQMTNGDVKPLDLGTNGRFGCCRLALMRCWQKRLYRFSLCQVVVGRESCVFMCLRLDVGEKGCRIP